MAQTKRATCMSVREKVQYIVIPLKRRGKIIRGEKNKIFKINPFLQGGLLRCDHEKTCKEVNNNKRKLR